MKVTCHAPPGQRVRFKGIGRDANQLGVTREHLWRVLTARRESKSLLARYKVLANKKERNQ